MEAPNSSDPLNRDPAFILLMISFGLEDRGSRFRSLSPPALLAGQQQLLGLLIHQDETKEQDSLE